MGLISLTYQHLKQIKAYLCMITIDFVLFKETLDIVSETKIQDGK